VLALLVVGPRHTDNARPTPTVMIRCRWNFMDDQMLRQRHCFERGRHVQSGRNARASIFGAEGK
jgi:hypothetical protein